MALNRKGTNTDAQMRAVSGDLPKQIVFSSLNEYVKGMQKAANGQSTDFCHIPVSFNFHDDAAI